MSQSTILESPAPGQKLAVQVALLENTLTQSLDHLFEQSNQLSRLTNTLHTIAARQDCPVEVRELITCTLEAQ